MTQDGTLFVHVMMLKKLKGFVTLVNAVLIRGLGWT